MDIILVFETRVLGSSPSKTTRISNHKNIINEGFVKINKIQITQASIKIRSSDIVEVSMPEPKEVNIAAKDIKLDIRYEDADLLIINKSPEIL